ncbi:hypothetical protein BX666DRAFT_1970790 [Dichotomocladium elegans]|nr:hypothetical protein BX666DRAFT_1970790 [Dichotomocladium elegans]
MGATLARKVCLTNWWTQQYRTCFVDQYNKFRVTGPNNTMVNIDGTVGAQVVYFPTEADPPSLPRSLLMK